MWFLLKSIQYLHNSSTCISTITRGNNILLDFCKEMWRTWWKFPGFYLFWNHFIFHSFISRFYDLAHLFTLNLIFEWMWVDTIGLLKYTINEYDFWESSVFPGHLVLILLHTKDIANQREVRTITSGERSFSDNYYDSVSFLFYFLLTHLLLQRESL